MIKNIRKKPVTVRAVQWNGDNLTDVQELVGRYFRDPTVAETLTNPDLTGYVYDRKHSSWIGVTDKQWVIEGVEGEFYPIDPNVLANTYDILDD